MFRRFTVQNISMTPALEPGDSILAMRSSKPVKQGTIVVFGHDHERLVKRIIGTPGDTITVIDGTVHINGLPDRWGVGRVASHEPIVVPDGHWWVLGDRREVSSLDSRTVGAVAPHDWWRVLVRYAPTGRIGRPNAIN